MDRTVVTSVIGISIGIYTILNQYRTSRAFERPAQSLTVVLLLSGAFVILGDKFRVFNLRLCGTPDGRSIRPASPAKSSDGGDWFKKISVTHSARSSEDSVSSSLSQSRWKPRVLTGLIVAIFLSRLVVLQIWLKRTQCSKANLHAFLPFFISLYELWNHASSFPVPRQPMSLDGRSKPWERRTCFGKLWWWARDRWHIHATLTITLGLCALPVVSTSYAPTSTYICTNGTGESVANFAVQLMGPVLDSLALIMIPELLGISHVSRIREQRLESVGAALLASAGAVFLVNSAASMIWTSQAPGASWSLWVQIFSPLVLGFSCAMTFSFGLQLVLKLGLLETVAIITFLTVYISSSVAVQAVEQLWVSSPEAQVLFGLTAMVLTSLCLFEARYSLWASRANLRGTGSRIRTSILGVCFLCLIVRAFLSLHVQSVIRKHPIEELIRDAGEFFNQTQRQAAYDLSLTEAVADYKRFNGMLPPPRFNHWWKLATQLRSFYIGDFENIRQDLYHFWALSPQEIRRRTVEDCAQENNGIGCIRIRSGKAEVATNVPESHRWMLEGTVHMMRNFVIHLPDMDLAFNLNDESRVTLSAEDYESISMDAFKNFTWHAPTKETRFSPMDPNEKWPKVTVAPYPNLPSFQPIFDSFGAMHCDANSDARRKYPWHRGKLCMSCLVPRLNSTGPFPSARSGRERTDLCQQPDLAYLHGFYSAPSTFRGVQSLRPTFSQSQALGFHDIRYPGPWNYLDRDGATYAPTDEHPDPDYALKSNTLFWRGTTTEGFASGDGRGTWQGMGRQRFAALTNFPPAQYVLQPRSLEIYNPSEEEIALGKGGSAGWEYRQLSARQLGTYFSMNVSVLHPISRCMHRDCDAQVAFFNRTSTISAPGAARHVPLTSVPSPFQSNWRYRFLFDTDGAGASGRFIPFLKSNSVPFKVTTIFREWWTGRVTPWVHYVPVDARLVGLYSTLAYFAGYNGNGGKETKLWDGRQDQAKKIALAGRKRANDVLRKEDMELYLFRLLLEWGRMVDDNRDVIGYIYEDDPYREHASSG